MIEPDSSVASFRADVVVIFYIFSEVQSLTRGFLSVASTTFLFPSRQNVVTLRQLLLSLSKNSSFQPSLSISEGRERGVVQSGAIFWLQETSGVIEGEDLGGSHTKSN